MKPFKIILLLLNFGCVFTVCAQISGLPEARYNLLLKAPITTWDEAIPLGNGLMGGLLWGENNTIRLSLDRGDLWDERTNGEPEWWKKHTYKKGADLINQKEQDLVNDWWNQPYDGVTPTKLPAGRVEIQLPISETIKNFELNLASAEGVARFNSDAIIKVIYSATDPVALVSINRRKWA